MTWELPLSRCSHSEPEGPGGWRDSTSGSPARSHWVSSLPDPEKSYGREQEAQELSDLLSTSCSAETAKCGGDSAAPHGAVWEGITSLIPVFRARNDSNFTNSEGLPGGVTVRTGGGSLPLVGVSSPLAAVADSGQCTACEVIWIPWQRASTWILSKPQESSREKVNIPSEPVLISKEGYWRRNWGWGGRGRHYRCFGGLLNLHWIMWLRQRKRRSPRPRVLSSHLQSTGGTFPTPWWGTFTTHCPLPPVVSATYPLASDNTFGFQFNFDLIL